MQRFTVSGSAGQQGGRRFAILDTHDRQGGIGYRRVEFHATFAAAQRKAKKLNDRHEWLIRKAEGERVAELLNALPLGTEFTLAGAGRAYSGTYRKNSAGLWDQVWAVESPLVTNFEAAHLGFCVGFEAVAGAVERTAL